MNPLFQKESDDRGMILDKIIETKKEEVAQLKKETSQAQLQKMIAGLEPCRISRRHCKAVPATLSRK